MTCKTIPIQYIIMNFITHSNVNIVNRIMYFVYGDSDMLSTLQYNLQYNMISSSVHLKLYLLYDDDIKFYNIHRSNAF